MDVREQLIDAALRVYARSGMRGATTRRIAEEAGVNEVTLFRQFGSKDALIHEALACRAAHEVSLVLPSHPVDPYAELREFCRQHYRALSNARALIRKCLGEFEEHPDATGVACQGPARLAEALEGYLRRLRATGLASGDWSPRAAAAMLMGTLFADAMGRDLMPHHYTHSEREAIDEYVALFIRAIGGVRHAQGGTTGAAR
jgi:AcrR family transcriptional regulator